MNINKDLNEFKNDLNSLCNSIKHKRELEIFNELVDIYNNSNTTESYFEDMEKYIINMKEQINKENNND